MDRCTLHARWYSLFASHHALLGAEPFKICRIYDPSFGCLSRPAAHDFLPGSPSLFSCALAADLSIPLSLTLALSYFPLFFLCFGCCCFLLRKLYCYISLAPQQNPLLLPPLSIASIIPECSASVSSGVREKEREMCPKGPFDP